MGSAGRERLKSRVPLSRRVTRIAKVLAPLMVVVALAMAGCLPPPAPPPETTTPTGPTAETACSPYPDATIDASAGEPTGANAFAYVLRLVCDYDDDPPAPRYRIPGTEGQTEAAVWLHDTLAAHGWNATYQNFTGADYQAIEDKDGAASWVNSCSAAAKERVPDLPFSNVIASRGSGTDVVLLLAHYDSKRFATEDPDPSKHHDPVLGANDGASGVGVLLEVARTWNLDDLPFETRIFFTDGEDGFEDCHPLAGSVYYADQLDAAERDRVRALLLLDMVGNQTETFMLSGNDDGLADRFRAVADELGVAQYAEAGSGGVTDDHSPFMAKGVPSVDVIPSGFSQTDYWHTTHDLPAKLHPDFLGDTARVVVAFLEDLAAS